MKFSILRRSSSTSRVNALLCLLASSLIPGLALAQAAIPAKEPDYWAMLRNGGYVVLMRHAQTVAGIGDPEGFKIGDCADRKIRNSQRNLSPAGEQQARATGARIVREGVKFQITWSSAWCRCVETARLAVGAHSVQPWLNSLFRDASNPEPDREAKIARAKREVSAVARQIRAGQNWLLVTHQVNVQAIAGVGPPMGQWVVMKPDAARGTLELVGLFDPLQ